MSTFDRQAWLRRTFPDRAAFESSAARRELTARSPLLFALVYLSHHLRSEQTGDRITLSDAVHRDWSAAGKDLATPGRPALRRCYVAPRELGKSTWWYLIVPLWAAAHGHTSFVAAYADSAERAEGHLATFTGELQTNLMLRQDYPDLCSPLERGRGRTVADRVNLYQSTSGFAFSARGMEAQTLGLKIGRRRPDLILLDDIEPAEERYSAEAVQKRLHTLQDTILPLNDRARVVLVGTVTRVDSIVHRLVKVARGEARPDDPAAPWVGQDRWEPHYYPPIATRDGERESVWPERWSLAELEAMEHTRSYAKNFANDPVGADGDYWTVDDFHHGDLPGVTRTLLSVDPAVTTKKSSDYTGFAVVEWKPDATTTGTCRVKRAWRVKATGDDVRQQVLDALSRDESIGLVLIETNQGGDLWPRVLRGLPVGLKTKHQAVAKEVRAAAVLHHYQTGRVLHGPGLGDLEAEMAGFPRAPHDDLVDAAGTGIAYFLDRTGTSRRPVVRQQAWA